MTKYFILLFCVIAGASTIALAQSTEKLVGKVEVYSLPKHLKSRVRISRNDIKEHKLTTRTILDHSLQGTVKFLLNEENYLGKVRPEFHDLDVRLLIEIIFLDGSVKSISLSSTNLIQIDSNGIYELKGYPALLERLRQCIPRRHRW
jgi:hypothetical protein